MVAHIDPKLISPRTQNFLIHERVRGVAEMFVATPALPISSLALL